MHQEVISEVDKAILKNEWSHVEVEVQLKNEWSNVDAISDEYPIQVKNLSVGNPQIGIHVFKEKERMEADVRFTNPYRKRKSDYQDDLFQVHSQLRPFKKQRTCAEL
jgi:hypothetical protein